MCLKIFVSSTKITKCELMYERDSLFYYLNHMHFYSVHLDCDLTNKCAENDKPSVDDSSACYKDGLNYKNLKVITRNCLDEMICSSFPNVVYYDISENEIEQLTSDNLNFKLLETLKSSNNKLSDISGSIFMRAPNLKEIDFSNNNIDKLSKDDFMGAGNITNIKFSENSISIVEDGVFLNTPNLTEIDMSKNKINKLDKNFFKGATKLTKINFSENNISIIEADIFVGLHNLTTINLSNNKIVMLYKNTFSEMKNLGSLNLKHNLIETIETGTFKNNKKVYRLTLVNNPIHTIDENVLITLIEKENGLILDVELPCEMVRFDSSFLQHHTNVDSKKRKIDDFFTYNIVYNSICKYKIFKNLKYLNITGNQLDAHTVSEILRTLGSEIEILDLSSNDVPFLDRSLFVTFTNLKYVNLRNTKVTTDMDGYYSLISFGELFRKFEKLEVVRLEENPITILDADIFSMAMNSVEIHLTCENVKHIDTSFLNKSLSIELNGDDAIFRLTGDKLKLRCTKERFKQLKNFTISNNHLQNAAQVIEWLGNHVEVLDVASNFIGNLNSHTFDRFNNLQYLNLSNTQMMNLGFKTFYHMNSLQTLDISFNQLKKVNFTTLFQNNSNLEVLKLEGNHLLEIDSVTQSYFPNLLSLDFSRNNFSCQYLAKMQLLWNNQTLVYDPSNQTIIDEIGCWIDDNDVNDGSNRCTYILAILLFFTMCYGCFLLKRKFYPIIINTKSSHKENINLVYDGNYEYL